MNKNISNIKTVSEYNDLLGVETLHPLVSVIDLSKVDPINNMRLIFDFYVVFLKEDKNCDLLYGRQRYDYQKGSIVSLAPGQVIGTEDTGEKFQPKGWALCFHPDLIRGTTLGRNIKEYCLEKIRYELQKSIDRLSKRLIATNIELLLDYCLRFYERQFITRGNVNHDILTRFERLLDDYFIGPKAAQNGLPSVKECANKLCLSPNYFGDLIKKETGKTAQEYIQYHLIEIAKEQILDPGKSISQIAYGLGFQYPQHFTRLFKRLVGQTPNEYRSERITA